MIFFSSNSDFWISASSALAASIILAILGYYIRHIIKCNKIRELKATVNNSGNWIKDELAREQFRKVPIKYHNRRLSVNRMRGSFILHGDAGSGKSMALKKHYLIEREKANRALCYFYEAAELVNTDFILLEKTTHDSKFNKIVFYFDGIDETDKATEDFFYNMRGIFQNKKLYFRISCRDTFFNNIRNSEIQTKKKLFTHFYQTTVWKQADLVKYAESLINADKQTHKNKAQLKDKFSKQSSSDWGKINYSPLMCKMLYDIYKNNIDYIPDSNRFMFYKSFITESVLITLPDKEKQLSDFADIVYFANSKRTAVTYNDIFKPILKSLKNEDDKVAIFTHETFREFFIAYHIICRLKNISEEAIESLSQPYANEISDFISDGLLTLNEPDITNVLISIYNLVSNMQTNKPEKIVNYIKSLSPEKIFRLKFSIVFRLGRLRYQTPERSKLIVKFFKDIYYHADNQQFILSYDDNNANYWRAVFKRCCAISSSFLGGYEIEIDYVTRLLDWKANYDADYDLANRSNTLCFYGDVASKDDIFGYIDRRATCSCDKALHKRINRLSEINDIDNDTDIKELSPKLKRKYYFRLFDISTIYTFIKSRKYRADLLNVTKKDIKIIKNFKTSFKDGSDIYGRADLISEIKQHTIDLIKANKIK